jgi:hypothetical protein
MRDALRSRWQRWRWPVTVGAIVLASGLIGLVLLRPTGQARLDPRSAAPDGAGQHRPEGRAGGRSTQRAGA